MTSPSEDVSNKYFDSNSNSDSKKDILWDLNKNSKLEVEEIEKIISKDIVSLQNEIDNSIVSNEELKTAKEKFEKNFVIARYVNMRPDTWTNLQAMDKNSFIDELKSLWELDIGGKKIDMSKIADPYLWVKALLSYLWYTGVGWNQLDLNNTSLYPGKILPEQKDLYIALLKFQNLNYWEAEKPQSSYLSDDKDGWTKVSADGIIGWYTLRWLIKDAQLKKELNWNIPSDINSEVVPENDIIKTSGEWQTDVVITVGSDLKDDKIESLDNTGVVSENWAMTLDTQDVETETDNNEAKSNVSIEKIWDWEFPKIKDIYSEGEDNYLFTLEDTKGRWIDDISFVPTIYNTLQIENNLENIGESSDLKNMLIRPWFEQMWKVIEDMRKWITVDWEKYTFTYEQIKLAIENKWFIKTIEKDGKEYELVFDTWTSEMNKIINAVRPLWNKEYNKSWWESGWLKEKYQIRPVWLIYKWVRWLFKKQDDLWEIVFWDRVS